RELLPVVTREAEIIVRGPEQMRAIRRMRRMARRALPLRHRHVDVHGFELCLLRRVAGVTELRHFFFENESSHDSVAFVAGIATAGIAERLVNDLLRRLLRYIRVTLDAL